MSHFFIMADCKSLYIGPSNTLTRKELTESHKPYQAMTQD